MVEVDPDIITGFNFNNFDLPYFGSFDGMNRRYRSRVHGKRDLKIINLTDRVQLDVLHIVKRLRTWVHLRLSHIHLRLCQLSLLAGKEGRFTTLHDH